MGAVAAPTNPPKFWIAPSEATWCFSARSEAKVQMTPIGTWAKKYPAHSRMMTTTVLSI